MDKKYSQGMKDRMDESRSMKKSGGYEVDGLKDKKVMGHASRVYEIDTNSEQYDMGRCKPMKQGMRGYPQAAFDGRL